MEITKGKPTPTPWAIGFTDGSGGDAQSGIHITAGCHPLNDHPAVVASGGRDDWGVMQGIRRREDAELIVTACNTHAMLVKTLEHVYSQAKLFAGCQQTSAHETLARLAVTIKRALAEVSLHEHLARIAALAIDDDE